MLSARCGVVSEASDFAPNNDAVATRPAGSPPRVCDAPLGGRCSRERLHTERLSAAVGAEEALVVAAIADTTGGPALRAVEEVVVARTSVEQSAVTVAHCSS